MSGIDQLHAKLFQRADRFIQRISRFEQVEPAEQTRSAALPRLPFCRGNGTANAAVRAAALDRETATLLGIDVRKVIFFVFALGPGLGGVAGLMNGLYYRAISFNMGWNYGLKAFTATILGGIGNIPGAMLGGLILGVVESLLAGYVSGAWKDVFVFILLIAILIFRPRGLLGEKTAEKV